MTAGKVTLGLDKKTWRPSVLPGQIVVVSTVNERREPNLAPKSWITMAAFTGPIIAVGCNTEHTTYQNIRTTGEFVINIPAEPLVERIYSLIRHHGEERIQHSGFTLSPAQKVKPPIVQECRAHLECQLDSVKEYGGEVLILGKIVAASIDPSCVAGEPPQRYFCLRPIFFLEEGTYGSIDTGKQVGREWPVEHRLFVVELREPPELAKDRAVIGDHVAFLRDLWAQGRLLMAGPFANESGGGMYVIDAASKAEAEEVACRDPLVRAGARYAVKTWIRTF